MLCRRADAQVTRAYARLREDITPMYEPLFQNLVAELDDGIQFVVSLRQDLLPASPGMSFSPECSVIAILASHTCGQ